MFRFVVPLTSLILYWIAPSNFEHWYVVLLLIIYVVVLFLFLWKNWNCLKFFNFTVLFGFSVFLCNFVYPVFVHPYIPLGLLVHNFDDSYICRGVALALVGMCFFLLGEDMAIVNKCKKDKSALSLRKPPRNDIFDTLSLVLVWVYALVVLILSNMSYNLYNDLLTNSLTIVSFVYMFLIITMISHFSTYNYNFSILNLLRDEWKYILGILLVIIGLFKIGDRGPIIQLSFALFSAYYILIGNISLKKILLYILIGVMCMVYIRNNRIDGQYESAMAYREQKYGVSVPAYIDIFTDLVTNARCMYVGLDYVDREGFLNGKSFIKPLASPIPFLPTIITQSFYNLPPSSFSTGTILTEMTESEMGREVEGVGTNNIVDIYMNWGVIGVCILMYAFGMIVGLFEVKKSKNLYCLFGYCILMSLAIYIPRSTIFDFLRTIIWGCGLFWLRNQFPNKFKSYAYLVH